MKMIFRFMIIFSCLLLVFSGELVYAQSGYVDVHVHIDPMAMRQGGSSMGRRPRRQRGPGPRGGGETDYEEIASNIVYWMDEMGVDRAVLMPPPQVQDQKGVKGSTEDYDSAVRYYPDRFYLGGGGDTLNKMIYQYDEREVTDKVRDYFRDEAERLIRAGVVVFGEMAALHISMHEQHIFSQVNPDHPLFLLLADIAAENNIPIDLHMEAIPGDIPTPESLLEISSRNPYTIKGNVKELSRLLEHNRKAKIVWQHIGWDNVGYTTIELLSRMLDQHPNLFLALRVEYRGLKMDRSGPMPNRIVDEDWVVTPEWKKFITYYADRIVIGSDDFMGIIRRQSRPKDSFVETWDILDQFPRDIAQMIGSDNAVWIYNLD